jgi:hypothetical protein
LAALLLDCGPHRANLQERISKAGEVLDASHPPVAGRPDVGSAARGLTIVLLYAAYEQLLTSLCRSLLETAASLRVGNKRLRPGLQLFSVFNLLQGAAAVGTPQVWRRHGPELIRTLHSGQVADLPTNLFPRDGSFMKRSQVTLFTDLMGLPHPGPVLKEVWARLDTVVGERNNIAHGNLTADEVGRRYSVVDVQALTYLWGIRWAEFLDAVEQAAATRDFYRR